MKNLNYFNSAVIPAFAGMTTWGSFLFLLIAPVFGSSNGTTGANFLALGVGARSLALGDAVTAESGGVEALYSNPAGLVNAWRPTLMLSYNPIFEGTSHNQAAFSFKQDDFAFGLGYNGVLYNSISSYDDVGNQLPDYKAADHLGTFGVAMGNDQFSVGVNAKYINSTIDKKSATAFAGDAGILFVNPFMKTLSHALVAKNYGSSIKFIDQADKLPSSLTFGNSLKLGSRLTVLADGSLVNGAGSILSAGVEANMFGDRLHGMAVRGGYTTKRNEADGLSGLSMGVGFAFGSVSLDYAWIPYGDLGNSHAITLLWNLPSFKPRVRRTRSTSSPDIQREYPR